MGRRNNNGSARSHRLRIRLAVCCTKGRYEFWWLKPIYLASPNLPTRRLPFGVLFCSFFPPAWFPRSHPVIAYSTFLTSANSHVRVMLHSNIFQYTTQSSHVLQGRRSETHSLIVSLFASLCHVFPRMGHSPEGPGVCKKSWGGQKICW